MKILFVCTGNTCRSPMAEAIFNKLCSKEHSAFSRGTGVFIPQKISQKSVEALKMFDIDNSSHKSAMVCEEDIRNSDLVLTMTSAHKMALKSSYPSYKQKIFTLNEKATGKDSDIEDPYGLGQENYNECAKEIYNSVEKLLCML